MPKGKDDDYETPAEEGDVYHLYWLSATGKHILMAITPDNREHSRVECEEADIDVFTKLMRSELRALYWNDRARSTTRHRGKARGRKSQSSADARPLALVR